jgi:hypothetical protein
MRSRPRQCRERAEAPRLPAQGAMSSQLESKVRYQSRPPAKPVRQCLRVGQDVEETFARRYDGLRQSAGGVSGDGEVDHPDGPAHVAFEFGLGHPGLLEVGHVETPS